MVGRYPEWASSPAGYQLDRGSFKVVAQGSTFEGEFPKPELSIFEKPLPRSFPLPSLTRAAVSIQVHISPPPTVAKDLIDAYGQVVAADLPSRVRTDADLRAEIADEAERTRTWEPSPQVDPYGGWKNAPWHDKGSGFYRVVKHLGKWTLLSPQGNPLFYIGLCTAPAPYWDVTPTTGRESIFAALPPKGDLWRGGWGDGTEYFTPIGWSLQRKYGQDWNAKAVASMKWRLQRWGFSGMGKWAEPVAGVPRIVDLYVGWPKLVRHLDPFDSKSCAAARASLTSQLAAVRGDPFVVGNSIGNEYEETVTLDEIEKVQKGPASPAQTALAGLEPEAARKKYAASYYKFVYETVKSIDPDHLYLGYWVVPGWWQNESDWDLIAPYCDVIGYDRYSDLYAGMEDRQKRTDKPALLGEFSYPAWYGGARGYGRYTVFTETDADSGLKYGETIAAAAKDPYCVGALWFQYRDEPVTGRGPGRGLQATQGEHYAFGFVDVNDRPKWDLVSRARTANQLATALKVGK